MSFLKLRFTAHDHTLKLKPKHTLIHVLKLALVFALTTVTHGAMADVTLFPANINIASADGRTVFSVTSTLDGETIRGRLIRDFDNDSIADMSFEAPNPDFPICNALWVVPSSLGYGRNYLSTDLDQFIRIYSNNFISRRDESTA